VFIETSIRKFGLFSFLTCRYESPGLLLRYPIAYEFQAVFLNFPVVLALMAVTLPRTGRESVNRIVDKDAVGTGVWGGKRNNPDVMPGLKG
jgi:hypothetical protein